MPSHSGKQIPKYRLHKATGQAAVVINGRWIYLGRHGTPESRERYDRLIGEWLAAGRQTTTNGPKLTVVELIAQYWVYAKTYYVKNGRPTSELYEIRCAMRPLKNLYGRTSAAEFGPKNLKTVRQALIDGGLSRSTVTKRTGIIKRLFRWGVESELIPASVHHGLLAISGLRRGRCGVRETEPVKPVPDEHVDAILPYVSRQVSAMIRLQLLTGMRPGEVVIMRAKDLDMGGKHWDYSPSTHKMEHHGLDRRLLLGPRAQAVVREFLRAGLDTYLFTPEDAEAARSAKLRQNRRTPVPRNRAVGSPRKPRKRLRKDHYDVASYRRAIARACDRADADERRRRGDIADGGRIIPRWSPNRLRHNFATQIRMRFGVEMARVLLGHQSIVTTEIYAERDRGLATSVIERVG